MIIYSHDPDEGGKGCKNGFVQYEAFQIGRLITV